MRLHLWVLSVCPIAAVFFLQAASRSLESTPEIFLDLAPPLLVYTPHSTALTSYLSQIPPVRKKLDSARVLSLPNMFTTRARHSIRRFVLGELLFANWAGFGHDVGHNSYLSHRLKRLPGYYARAIPALAGTGADTAPARLGCQAMTATLRRAIGKPLIGLAATPPCETHFVGLAG